MTLASELIPFFVIGGVGCLMRLATLPFIEEWLFKHSLSSAAIFQLPAIVIAVLCGGILLQDAIDTLGPALTVGLVCLSAVIGALVPSLVRFVLGLFEDACIAAAGGLGR
ncbi:MAG: hypothetical protein WBK28_00530 [Minisyncoccia bacterium]